MVILNPLRRFVNYLCDGPFWQKRWLPIIKDFSRLTTARALLVPGVRSAKAKQFDPDWRKKSEWVLICSTGDVVCYPAYFTHEDSKLIMRSLLPIRTRMFAMRVGSKPFWVLTINPDRKVAVPKFCSMLEGSAFEYTVMSRDDIEYLAITRGQPVTFI